VKEVNQEMRKALLTAAILAVSAALAVNASAYTKEAAVFDGGSAPYGLSQDCLLQTYNTCAGWVWIFSDDQGAVWGTVLDPNDCPEGCANGGAVSDIWFWGYCSPGAPADINGVDVELVDGVGCPTALLFHSGALSVVSCVTGDRWTHVAVDIGQTHLDGSKFAITIEWGPASPLMRFATDNGIGNLFCYLGYVGTFPGCATTGLTCAGWSWTDPGQLTYIYVTDFNGDTVLDDLCAIYGYPYPLFFPYVNYFGYMPNNLMVIAGLDCHSPTAVENTSWGHVKALYD
jgi:uncharacterized membrane protein